jgi:hypothetical protein
MSNSEIKYMTCDAPKPLPSPSMPASVNSAAEELILLLRDLDKESKITHDIVKDKLQYVMVIPDGLSAQKHPEQTQEYPLYFLEMRICIENIYTNLDRINHFMHRTSL